MGMDALQLLWDSMEDLGLNPPTREKHGTTVATPPKSSLSVLVQEKEKRGPSVLRK